MKETNHKPSIKDYTAFHGMLCGPVAAHRCIQSFQGGALLFASQEDYDTSTGDLYEFDHNAMPMRLDLWSYYLLVLASLTGCCSALGCTKVVSAIDYLDNDSDNDSDRDTPPNTLLRFKTGDNLSIESSKNSTMLPLRLPPKAMEYVMDRYTTKEPKNTEESDAKLAAGNCNDATPELTLIRRFEYDFGGFLSVMMLHFRCTHGRTHLIEIYRLDRSKTVGAIVSPLLDCLTGLKFILMNLWPRQVPIDGTKKTA